MPKHAYLAIDLGAESGRAIVGVLDAGRLTLHEAHRFIHAPVQLPSGLHWDITGLWHHVIEGIRRGCDHARGRGLTLRSVGVDTWGVDFALIGRRGELLGLPHAYRDPRNQRAYRKAIQTVGERGLYEATGVQLMAINSLYQLIAARDAEPTWLEHARHLLFMPDLLHFWLTDKPAIEKTIASTSQMVEARTGGWAHGLLQKLDLPTHMLGEITEPGTSLGPLRSAVGRAVGAPDGLGVVRPAGHDTACAVAAVPARGEGSWCFLSSGTWSLLGAELDEPCITDAAFKAGFTNEAGATGTTRLLKNITGLWLLQEVRRDFARRGRGYDYAAMVDEARRSEPMRTLVDPHHAPFLAPGDMPAKLRDFARRTDQPQPDTMGQLARCCMESLALAYRDHLDELERVLGRRLEVMHLVGGGGRNQLLNQMTADAIGRPVLVGPDEATAIGNVLIQAMGDGAIASLTELRALVAASFPATTYAPSGPSWGWALTRWRCLRDATA